MADPITERTAELEQGLKDFQTTVEARTNAPALPLTQPDAASVDPNAAPPITMNQVSVPPPQDEAPETPAPAQHPTWDQVSALPAYKDSSPEKKLVTFSRWHDSAYNMLQSHPDWPTVKDAFNKGAADKQAELSKAAGGIDPNEARTKVANEALAQAETTNKAPLNKEQVRAVLTPLGPDVAKSYFDSLQPDTGVMHEAMNDIREFGVQMGQGLEKSVQGLAQMSADQLKTGDVEKGFLTRYVADTMMKLMPDAVRKQGQQFFQDAADYWQQRAAAAGAESGVDPKLANSNGAVAARLVAGIVRPVANFPSFIAQHRLETYADAHDAGKSPAEASAAADRATMGDVLWTGLGHLVGAGLSPVLEKQGVNGIRAWAVKASAAISSNISAGQLLSAAEAAANAPAGERLAAFGKAFNKLEISDAVIQAAFGLVGAGSPLEAKTDPVKVAQDIIDKGKAAAANAQAAGSPEVAKAVQEVTQKQADVVKQEAAQKAAKAAEPVKQEPPVAGENNITITHDVGSDEPPKLEIPPDATIEHLQETKKEIDKNYPKDSADANELHRQVDEAIAEKEKAFAPEAPKSATTEEEISPEELKSRQAQVEQHRARVGEPTPTSGAAKEAVEAIKNGNVKDLSYDGKGMAGEQFTEVDPHSPSFGATFEVPTNASLHDLLEKRIEVRDKFAGTSEEPRGTAPEERVLEKPELSALNKRAYADAQEMKRKSGRGRDFDVTAAYNARRVELLKEARSKPAPVAPKAGEGATRAERSAANKAAHRAEQQAASAQRKEARAKAPGMAEAQEQITTDTVKRGVVPGLDEIQEAHPNMDITTAQDLRRKLQGELAKAYPPEAVPEGSRVTTIDHDYTKEELPMIETKDADGVTRTRPQFTNDPEITAQQKDQGLFSNDAGNRLYIPDELLDNEKVNPAISDHMKWDPDAKQYYVGVVDTALGRVHSSHEEAVLNQEKAVSRKEGEAPAEQQRSYTQLRQEQDAFGKAHAHIAVGDKLEAVSEAVRQHAEDRGLGEDSIQYDSAPEEGPKTEIGVIDDAEAEKYANLISRQVTEKIAKEQTDEADDLGLIQHEGRTRVNLNDVLDHVIADPKTPPFMREIAKLIKNSGFDLSHMRIKIVSNPSERYGGRYWHQSDTMEFNLAGGRHLGGIKTTFMHEMVHGVLDVKLEPEAKRNPAEQRAYETLKGLHDKLSRIIFERSKGRPPESVKELEAFQEAQYGHYEHADNLGRDYYGLSNLFEFATESMTNPRFDALVHEVIGEMKPAQKSIFENIIDKVKSAIMTLIGGKDVTPTSPLYHSLDSLFTLIKEGPSKETVRGITIERANRERIKFQGAEKAKADLKKLFDEANKGKEYKPDLNKVTDKQGLNRAERSKVNKEAYRLAQEEAKRQGKGFDVMKEYERIRAELIADRSTFTAEGRAKMAEVNARQAEEAPAGDTGMTQEELNAEIAGEAEPQKPTLNLLSRVEGNGWVTPEGKFLPVDERYHQGLTAGVNPLVFGGHGSHGSAAWEYIQSKPELASAFEKAAADKGYGSILDMSEGDVKDFLEARGFLRVNHDNTNTYFTGKRGANAAGEKLLMNHAQENGRTLIHDRETADPRNSLKELYRPAHLQGGADALGFFEPRSSATEPADEEQAKIKYTQRAGGKRNISFEGVPNKAQVEATNKMIDDDPGSSPAVKSALKQQVAITAQQQTPTLVQRIKFTYKNPLTGKSHAITPKDTGNEIIVAGGNSASNIPRIMGEQGANRVAQDYGSVAKPTKEILQDRSASTLIVDSGKDLKTLQDGRDHIANGAESGKQFLPLYDYAIENFERLKDKQVHADEMKAQAEREQTNGIDVPMLENYVTRVMKSPDVGDGDMITLPGGKAGGNRYFMKARSYETLADAIHDGFVPKTLDIAELDQHRIEAGERIIQQKQFHESLKSVLAPDGKAIVTTTQPRSTLYQGEVQAVPAGYAQVHVPGGGSIVVHNDYLPLFKAIYGDSRQTALSKWAGFMKRNTLVLDTFHVGRIMFKEAAFSKGAARFGWGKGLSILEYSKPDLAKALQLGDINQQQHDYAMEHYEDAQALIKSGLNVAKISDNLNAELAKAIPFLKNFNPWVFGKLSRGAMLQTALANLERNQARFGELGRDEILRRTSKETNEVFGNLGLQSVFKDPQVQNTMRSLMLAPQWAESQLIQEFRGYGQILKAPLDLLQGKARLGTTAQGQLTAVIGTFLAMQLVNVALTGKTTFQNKKGDWLNIHLPFGRAGFDFNPFEIGAEYAFMANRYLSQHMAPADVLQRIAFNKLNPVPHGVLNYILNRDYSGKRYQDNTARTMALAESAIPLPPLLGAGLERDSRQHFTVKELENVRGINDAARLAAHTLGMRGQRTPGAAWKSVLQSAGVKVSAAQTPRSEMFSLAARYRGDSNYGDNSPPVYRDLRAALDNHDDGAVRQEINMLVDHGHTEDQIKQAAGITHGGITPEKFTGKADLEKLFLHALTPEQKATYKEAQADHKANANRLRAALSDMKLHDTDLVKALHKNAQKPKASDFPTS